MSNYILKKWYPSLGKDIKVGDVVHMTTEGIFVHDSGVKFVERELSDNGFWAKLHGFMIVEFERNSGGYKGTIFNRISDGGFRCNIMSSGEVSLKHCMLGGFNIHKVVRGSDKAAFKVGDVLDAPYGVSDPWFDKIQIIEGFEFKDNHMLVRFKQGLLWKLEEVGTPLRPILKTEDGVDIYEGQSWLYVIEGGTSIRETSTLVYGGSSKNKQPVKRYSTRKVAEEAVKAVEAELRKNPLFLTFRREPIIEGDTYWCVNTAPHLWSVFKQRAGARTKLNKTVIAFLSKLDALRYVSKHKPVWSIMELYKYLPEDSVDMLWTETKQKVENGTIINNNVEL